MNKQKNSVDVIAKVLDACYTNFKNSLFIMGMMHNYEERGWLTRKQLVDLHKKASTIPNINAGWLATIQANIDKLPIKDKTPATVTPINNTINDPKTIQQIETILQKYPTHKALLAIQAKHKKNIKLSVTDANDVVNFFKVLIK